MSGNEIAFTITLRIGTILLVIACAALLLEKFTLIRPSVRRLAWFIFFAVIALGCGAGIYLAPAVVSEPTIMSPRLLYNLNVICFILGLCGIVLVVNEQRKKSS